MSDSGDPKRDEDRESRAQREFYEQDQPSPTNLGDELENIIGKGLGWSKYDQPEDYEMSPFGGMWVSSDGKSGYDITGIVSAITAAYAEAIRRCVPEKKDMGGYESVGADGGIDTTIFDSEDDPNGAKNGEMLAHLAQFAGDTCWNDAIDTMLDNLKKKGLLPDDPIKQEKP